MSELGGGRSCSKARAAACPVAGCIRLSDPLVFEGWPHATRRRVSSNGHKLEHTGRKAGVKAGATMGVFDRLKDKARDLTKRAKPIAENLTKKVKPVSKNLSDRAEHLTETVKTKTKKVAEELHHGAEHHQPTTTAPAAAPPQPSAGEAPQTASDGVGQPTDLTGNAAEEPPRQAP